MNELLADYTTYRETADREAGSRIAARMYRELNYWIEYGFPSEEWVGEFWDLYSNMQGRTNDLNDLLDLGLVHTAEAISLYRESDNNASVAEFYVHEAKLPFFAFIDEPGYRIMKNIEFTEIDFLIFEIIQGDFPHEVAQSFLVENEWVDIWSCLRYFDNLEDRIQRNQILHGMLQKRKTMQERLILLAYLFYSDGEAIRRQADDAMVPLLLEFPPEWIHSLLLIAENYFISGSPSVNWQQDMYPAFENETIFFLIALYEITQSDLTPGWISLLEKGLSTIWTYPYPEPDGNMKIHQPIQEFTASILSLLGDSEIEQILNTSLIIPLFFENMNRYNNESFHQFLTAFSLHEELLLQELNLAMPSFIDKMNEKDLLQGRMQEIATYFGKEIKIQNGVPLILHSDGSIN